jgi:hypothetical protein
LQFLIKKYICNFFQFFVITTLDPDPEPVPDSLETLDPDPINPFPQHCFLAYFSLYVVEFLDERPYLEKHSKQIPVTKLCLKEA